MSTRVREMQLEGAFEASKRDDESYPVWHKRGYWVMGWINKDGSFVTSREFRHGRGEAIAKLGQYKSASLRRNMVRALQNYNRWCRKLLP